MLKIMLKMKQYSDDSGESSVELVFYLPERKKSGNFRFKRENYINATGNSVFNTGFMVLNHWFTIVI